MSNLERYIDRMIARDASDMTAMDVKNHSSIIDARAVASSPGEGEEATTDIFGALKRRWYIVLLMVLLVAPIGVLGVWYTVQPGYIVIGRIRIAPAVQDILTGNPDRGEIGNYGDFVATQAFSITSNTVLQRVADDLVSKDLTIFKEGPQTIGAKIGKLLGKEPQEKDILSTLKGAVSSGAIAAVPRNNTELIEVRMKSMYPDEAKVVVDAIIRNYMSVYAYGATQQEEDNLRTLENERDVLMDRLKRGKDQIREMAEQYGTTDLDTRQDVMAERENILLNRLMQLEAKRVELETTISILERGISNDMPPEQVLAEREKYINSDPYVNELSRRIIDMEQELLVTKQTLAPTNPVIQEQQKLIDVFQEKLAEKKKEKGQEFDELISGKSGTLYSDRVMGPKMELEGIKVQEARYRQMLEEQGVQAREMGNAHLKIQDMQFQLELDQQLYDTMSRRIKQVEMERKQRPRITRTEPADVDRFEDNRVKFSLATLMGSLGLGCLLAFWVDKNDRRLKVPEDVAKHTSLPFIGTVANARSVRASKFAEQTASDYQTIRTNLSLVGENGIAKKLCVTSPGPREGKSLFSVNLATSLAKSGERVLLIDGDLRKPDTLRKMSSTHVTEQKRRVPFEDGFAYTLWTVSTTGLDIMVPDVDERADVYELLTSPQMSQRINALSTQYDHIIVDTPPVLAFPDALIWARIAGSVLLITFAGKTTIDDLQEANARVVQTGATVLGTVLNNVRATRSYQRYHYGYYYHRDGRRDVRMNRKILLPLAPTNRSETPDQQEPVNVSEEKSA